MSDQDDNERIDLENIPPDLERLREFFAYWNDALEIGANDVKIEGTISIDKGDE